MKNGNFSESQIIKALKENQERKSVKQFNVVLPE